MSETMSLRMTEDRERRLEDLKSVLDENTKSKAIDQAARYTTRMKGGDPDAMPTGRIAQLMELADEQGSVTPAEIAEVLSTEEVPVDYSSEWSVG